MVESEGAFRLTFVQGRGLLSLAGRDFEGLGHVDSLELEIPNLRFPFDLSGGVARFKNRRLRLRELSLAISGRELTGFLARAPLADFGIYDARVSVEGSHLGLCARVLLGGHEAEVTAAATLSLRPPRGVGLCVHDVRAYGFLPIPVPLVVTALFTALGAESPANRDSVPDLALPPLVRVRSATEVDVDACALAMLAILPMHGWRLPELGKVRIRAAGGIAKSTRIPLVFSLADVDESEDPLLGEDASPEAYQVREFAARCAPIEDALARGDVASALAQLRVLAPIESDDRVGAARLLQLLLASETTLAEASEVAESALVRWPEFTPALLASAIVAAECGQHGSSAILFDKVARLAAAQGRNEDENCALLASAMQSAAAEQTEVALATLERALLRRPSLRPVSRAKLMKQAVEGHWRGLLASIGEESILGELDMVDEVTQVVELVRQGGLAKDATLIAHAAESLEALLRRPEWPETSLSRAEAAYQMGLVRATLGDDSAASHWFATCIEGDASGAVAAAAWRALTELMQRRADQVSVAQALVGWAGDARVPEDVAEKVKHLLEAAEVMRRELRQPSQAAALLETALGLSPADGLVLSALERVADEAGATGVVVDVLRRHLRETRPDQGKAVLRLLIRLLTDNPEQHEEAREACRVLLDLVPDDEDAILGLARIDWRAGDRARAGLGYRRIADSTTLASPALAECHLRMAQLAEAAGDHAEVQRQLDLALRREPEGARLDVLAEALQEVGQTDRLGAIFDGRSSGLHDPADRRRLRRALAAAAERAGDVEQAESIYRTLLDEEGDDPALLDHLVQLHRRKGDGEALVLWLERLWTLVERVDSTAASTVDRQSIGLELAELLARDAGQRPRAEVILRRLLDGAPEAATLLDPLFELLVAQGDFEEAAKVFAKRLAGTSEQGVSSLLLTRARLCLSQPLGLAPALSLLQSLPIDMLEDDVVGLRSEVAERAGDMADALACLERLRERASEGERAALTRRLSEVALNPAGSAGTAIALLERLRGEVPDDLHLAQALFEAYGRLDDVEARTRAWQELLAKAPALPDVYRARVKMALSEAAEREGDLHKAAQMLDQASQLDHSPMARAEQLVVHARLLVARGELVQAQEELGEALRLNATSAAALALQGDLAYRAQEWEKARIAYTRLAQLPGAGQVVSPRTLAFRRAELAEMFGDPTEAEAAYREVLVLDPQNDGAREAMAGFALLRGDLAEAALHLQELARLLPKEAVDRLTQARQRLGQVYLGLGDLQAARQNLELAMASEPDRASTLELLATAYQRLGLHRDAAVICERLSRIQVDPSKKAEALFRKGEILRTALADEDGAQEAYLRSSDVDPSFAPSLARLVATYWARADLAGIADVGSDLVQASSAAKPDQRDVGLIVAVAALLERNDEALAKTALESPLLGAPLRPDLAAARLGELVARVVRTGQDGRTPFDALDRVLALLSSSLPEGYHEELQLAALKSLETDPADVGQAMVLARLSEQRGQIKLARSAYCLVRFLDGGTGVDARLSAVGEEAPAKPEAFAPDSAVHPLCQGPLRKVLHHLARALAGSATASYDEPTAPLAQGTLFVLEMLRAELAAPQIPVLAQGHGLDVTFSATQPLSILIGKKAEQLAPCELRFFLARALEQARAGTLAVLRMSPDNLRGMLRAVLRIAGAPATPFEIAEEAADESTALWLKRLRNPDVAALIPLEGGRDRLIADARQALAAPPDIDDYIRGCRYTADRVGLLACGRPLVALRALGGMGKDGLPSSAESAAIAQRKEQVRSSPALRELVAFLLSEEYTTLVEGV
jgi:tetratricopeptide (TPR) repeat protein